MAANKTMQVSGYTSLRKRIQQLRGAVAGGELINDALTEVAALGVERITDNVDQNGLVDTGAYKRGFNDIPATAGVAYIITMVAYALVIEYGMNGDVQVKEHSRKTKGGKVALVKSHRRRMVRPAYLIVTSVLPDIRKDMSRVFRRKIKEILIQK